VWKIPYPDALDIPGYQRLIFKSRSRGNGGGVGLYIRENLNFNVITTNFDSFVDKIFESVTVEICYPVNNSVKKIFVSSVYRSPTAITGMTPTLQHDAFLEHLSLLLDFLNETKCDSYVLLDANINLLNLLDNELSNSYLSSVIEKSFFPTNLKASRMQNGSHSLIDHILTNNHMLNVTSGSILEDISDHFVTFLQLNLTKNRSTAGKVTKRSFTTENLNNFKNDLQNLHWQELLQCNDVDLCYDLFWTDFKTLYDLHFPLRTVRFNRNYHKKVNL
jgi:hypothetical protein